MRGAGERTVVIVTPYFPPKGGGLEKYAFEIGRRLVHEHGWRVVVITSGERSGADEKAQTDGLTVYRLGYGLKISNTPLSYEWPARIRRILQEERPDIINIHSPVPGIGNIASSLSGGIPVVVTYHAGSMKKGRLLPDILIAAYERTLLPLMLRRADAVVSSSSRLKSGFLKQYRDKCTIIAPGADSGLFKPDLAKRPRDPTVLFAAGLSRAEQHKGLGTLIEAMGIVKGRIRDARLVVAGDGDMRAEYEAQVRRRGLEGCVSFVGRLNGDALVGGYQRAHVFALPTRNDSSPIVIIEAMASGLPVVSTTVGDIPEIIQEGETGFLVAPGDAVALAEKLIMLLGDPSRAEVMGAAARAVAVKDFSWSERADRYDKLFDTVQKKLYITQVSAYFPPHIGGVERMAKHSAKLLARDGHEVTVLTAQGSFKKSNVTREGTLTVKKLSSFEFAHTPIAPTLWWHLLRLPRKNIIHLHLAQAYWPEHVWIAAAIKRMRYIAHFHLDVEPSGPFGPIFVFYKRLMWGPILRGAGAVIVCSHEQAVLVGRKFRVPKERITVIPNAVGDDFFSVRPYEPSQTVFRLLSVGRLVPQKRVERLIETMAHLTIPAKLVIVGDGEDRARLQDLARAYGLSNISFEGAKDDAAMQEFHRASDAFLIASDREGGTPLAVLEAMAAGLPAIGTDVDGIRELLRDHGLLVDEPYAPGLAHAIEGLWNSREALRELSVRSREKARAHAWPRFIRELEDLYARIRAL